MRPETLLVRIERLAPTGEGVARTDRGVGFVDRALPGELVETTVYQVKRNFWRGSLAGVLEPSPDRRETAHSSCAACDWAHFDPPAARRAKQELSAETVKRIARLELPQPGELPIEPSAAGYRLRIRLHGEGAGPAFDLGFFRPRTHRLSSAAACEALSSSTRA